VTQIVIKGTSLCYEHGRVLYSTLSAYLHDHPASSPNTRITILETGTARGFSSLCMAKALKDQLRPGLIITFDVLPHRKKMYWNCVDDWDGPKTRAELLEPWRDLIEDYVIFHQGDTRLELPKIQAERIHFAFLDGSHDYKDLMFEFEQIRQRQLPGDIVVYDDYTPEKFPGVVKAVDEICHNHEYHTIKLQFNTMRGYVIAIKK
jgi:predicted O-methyltransferase YrrM